MTDSPRVLSIVWNLIRGGTEGQCARLALAMAARGATHRVAVFRREGFFLPEVERLCGPVHQIDITRMVSSNTLRAVRNLAGLIRREKLELVHAWDCDAAIFGSIAARLAGVPCITSHRDLGEIYPAHKLWLMRRADAGAAAVVVNARAIAESWAGREIACRDIVCIPNILDLDEFDALRTQACPVDPMLPPGRRIGMVTRLDPEKDGETIIRAAAIVCAKFNDVSFIIVGDGPERAKLAAFTAESGLSARVVFTGDVTYVPALLQRFTIGALVPRSNEGASNTILEYMAAGLPVVATDCGGNRELVLDGTTGLVIRPREPSAVAEAIVRLLADSVTAQAMGQRGREKVGREHDPKQVAEAFLSLYRRVAAGGTRNA
ncbi:MAG: glycosyltransferase [bacterium]